MSYDLFSAGAEAFLFKDIPSGIKHFAEMTGVQAAKLPTSEQIEQIKKEEDVLPPIGWSTVTDDGAMAAFRKTLIQQGLVAAMPFSNSNAFPVGGIIRTPLSDSEAELKEA